MTDPYKSLDGGEGRSVSGAADLPHHANLGKDLKAKASELTDAVKGKASELTNSVTRVAKDQAGEIGTAAKEIAADATGRVKSAMIEQKTASADYLGTIAQAVQRAAGEFEIDVPQAAQYIRQAAGQIETVANAVRQRDMRELVGEVQQFARRQPTLFFGGAVILGFAALRFFKSSAPGSGRAPNPGAYKSDPHADIGSRDFSGSGPH